MNERDPLIRRLERSALLFCAGAAALTAGIGRVDVALGVLAGGALIGASYWAIKSGMDGFLQAIGPRIHKGKLAFALAKFVGRYALLGLLAYVMIARLRLHPIGLIVGASSIVAAAGIETARNFGAGKTGRGGS